MQLSWAEGWFLNTIWYNNAFRDDTTKHFTSVEKGSEVTFTVSFLLNCGERTISAEGELKTKNSRILWPTMMTLKKIYSCLEEIISLEGCYIRSYIRELQVPPLLWALFMPEYHFHWWGLVEVWVSEGYFFCAFVLLTPWCTHEFTKVLLRVWHEGAERVLLDIPKIQSGAFSQHGRQVSDFIPRTIKGRTLKLWNCY